MAALVATMVLAAGWLVIDSARLAVSMPAQLNYLDGYMVDDANRLADGGPLYLDPITPPYSVTVYPPGSLAVMAGLIAAGVDGFSAGRILSLLPMLVIATLVVLSGVRKTGWVALVTGAALLLHPLQWPWSLVIRPDLLAAALSIAAVLLVAGRRRPAAVATSALLCVGALLCKQTAIAAPAAIFLSLLLRERRMAALFSAVFIASAAGSIATLQWTSSGRFLFCTVIANWNPFSWARALAMFRRFFSLDVLVVPVVAVLVVRSVRRRHLSLIGAYAVISLATALASGKVGSSLNYFLEPLGAIALWAAHELPVTWFDRCQPARAAIAFLLTLTVALSSTASWLDQLKGHHSSRAMLPLHRRLVETVAAVQGVVVSDDAAILVGAGRRAHFRPFIMTQLADAGRWDQTPFLTELREQRIAMIIFRSAPIRLHESRYTAAMRRQMDRGYRVAFTYVLGAPFTVMVPNAAGFTRFPAQYSGSPRSRGEVQSNPEGG